MESLDHTINGNGQTGLDRVTRDFIAEWRGVEKSRKEEEERRSREAADAQRRNDNWNKWLALGLTLLGVLLGISAFSRRIEQAPISATYQAQDRPEGQDHTPVRPKPR